MRMLFSQSTSEVWEKETMSEMKLGQLWGHSCRCARFGCAGGVGRIGLDRMGMGQGPADATAAAAASADTDGPASGSARG